MHFIEYACIHKRHELNGSSLTLQTWMSELVSNSDPPPSLLGSRLDKWTSPWAQKNEQAVSVTPIEGHSSVKIIELYKLVWSCPFLCAVDYMIEILSGAEACGCVHSCNFCFIVSRYRLLREERRGLCALQWRTKMVREWMVEGGKEGGKMYVTGIPKSISF